MSSESLLDRVRSTVAAVFNVPVESVTAESSMDTIENWDSMGQLILTLEIEQQFGLQLSPEQVEQMRDIAAIVTILESESL